MRSKWITGVVAVALCALAATSILAGSTKLISYQGRVTRADGSAVVDGTYPATFSFYTLSSGGVLLWTESGSVTTTGGLFTRILGSITPIADTLFPANGEVWLEVVFNSQLQTPRTQLLSTSYALRVNTVDGAQGGTITDSIVISPGMGLLRSPDGATTTDTRTVIGSTTNASLISFYEPLDSKSAGILGSRNPLQIGSKGLRLLDGDFTHTIIEPNAAGAGGYMFMSSPGAGGFFELDGNYLGTGNPRLTLLGSKAWMQFYGGVGGTDAVRLPGSAIDASEISDEPGIASRHDNYFVTLNSTSMTPIDSVTIYTPSDGYIVVEGYCTGERWGTPGANYIYFQIDSLWGGTWNYADYAIIGSNTQASAGLQDVPVAVSKTYYRTAGTYTFYLEGMGHPSNGTGWAAQAIYPTIRATFFPTSYGPVVTVVGQDDATAFRDKTAATGEVTGPDMRAGAGYSVDLRELELKAARLRVEAEKLERQVAETRLKGQLQGQPRQASDK